FSLRRRFELLQGSQITAIARDPRGGKAKQGFASVPLVPDDAAIRAIAAAVTAAQVWTATSVPLQGHRVTFIRSTWRWAAMSHGIPRNRDLAPLRGRWRRPTAASRKLDSVGGSETTQIGVGRRDRPMSQQITNRAQRRSLPLKADGIGVSERMGVNALLDSGARGEPWQQTPNVRVIEVSTAQGAEERRLPRVGEP